MRRILVLLLLIGQYGGWAQPRPGAGLENGPPKGYVCGRASGPITIDGKLTDSAWRHAPWTDAFVDIEGSLKPAPRFSTKVKMLWDENALYIGAKLEEPDVRATLRKRDTVIFYDNDFEVFIDPDGDNHEYFEMEMNALNTVWDLFLPLPYRDGGTAVDAWDIAGLRTAVHVDGTLNDPRDRDRGWSAEVAIPWRSLRDHAHRPAPPREGDRWRINFSRVEWDVEVIDGGYRKIRDRRENNWVWSPQWVIDMHWPELWGFVQFSTSSRARFVSDPSLPARTLLMNIYYAQVDYRKSHDHWAERLEEVGLTGERYAKIRFTPAVNGWTAELTDHGARWRVSQDSRLERMVP